MKELQEQLIRKTSIFEPIKDIQVIFDNDFKVATCLYKWKFDEELTQEIMYNFIDGDVYDYCNGDINNDKLKETFERELNRLEESIKTELEDKEEKFALEDYEADKNTYKSNY